MYVHAAILPAIAAIAERGKVAIRARIYVSEVGAEWADIMWPGDHGDLMHAKRIPSRRSEAKRNIDQGPE
jgi:hypothetical protein